MKRHINELAKQGFVKRIKRSDDSGRQRSSIYQLSLPCDSHVQQTDLYQNEQSDQASRIKSDRDKTDLERADLNNVNVELTGFPSASPEYPQGRDHSDTHLSDSRPNTESDHPAHIICHKEHKIGISFETGKAPEPVPALEKELLKLLLNHYQQGLTRTEIKALLVVNNNQSFVSLYRNDNIFIEIESAIAMQHKKAATT